MSGMECAESEHLGMNTVMTHRAYGRHAEVSLRAVQAEAVRLEKLLSRYLPGSEISGINMSAGGRRVRLSQETYEVLTRAAMFSQSCGGLFNVTVGPLVDLWRKGRQTCESPDDASIRRVLPLVDDTGLSFDSAHKAAGLRKAGQSIDLGGIGKGYAGDRFLGVFRQYGIRSAFTNIGGNVAALGIKPDGSPWRVGIRHPRRQNGLAGVLSVADKAVVTSGDDQRYFTDGSGKRRHHILDPRTGYPAESGLISVTVVADSSMDADALSTMLFVAGLERGIGLLKMYAETEAVLMDNDLHVYVTNGLRDHFAVAEGIGMEFLN